MMPADADTPARPPGQWRLRPAFTWRFFWGLLAVLVVLAISGHRTEIGGGLVDIGTIPVDAVSDASGSETESGSAYTGLKRFLGEAFPPVITRRTPLSLMGIDFDRDNVSWPNYIELAPRHSPEGAIVHGADGEPITEEYLVEPGGYLLFVLGLMLKTIEIAIWGTLLAVLLSIPLAYFSARGYSPNPPVRFLGRGLCSLSRAIPELISALIFVVMFGAGPFAGVLALGLHTTGFLGKFFADEIENTAPGPQEALFATGAGKVQVLRYAVLPPMMPQVLAYVQYILERNIRHATVLGIVGAGGIGQELMGQWNQFRYDHACTILIVIFATVIVLEQLTQRIRKRLI